MVPAPVLACHTPKLEAIDIGYELGFGDTSHVGYASLVENSAIDDQVLYPVALELLVDIRPGIEAPGLVHVLDALVVSHRPEDALQEVQAIE